jgi:DNA-binding response OmpR family regulator
MMNALPKNDLRAWLDSRPRSGIGLAYGNAVLGTHFTSRQSTMNTTVLVVDDDEVLGSVLARVLARRGYAVLVADTVAQGLELARQYRPKVALIDLCLPDGSGTELAAQLRGELDDIALILMTAFPLRLKEHPELEADFAGVLIKPLDLADLRHAIEGAASVT